MENVVLDVVKENVKVFTKEEKNNIISENYNPLKVNFKLICEREGLYMKRTRNILLEEVIEEPNFLEKIFFRFFKTSFINVYKAGVRTGFNWNNNDVR